MQPPIPPYCGYYGSHPKCNHCLKPTTDENRILYYAKGLQTITFYQFDSQQCADTHGSIHRIPFVPLDRRLYSTNCFQRESFPKEIPGPFAEILHGNDHYRSIGLGYMRCNWCLRWLLFSADSRTIGFFMNPANSLFMKYAKETLMCDDCYKGREQFVKDLETKFAEIDNDVRIWCKECQKPTGLLKKNHAQSFAREYVCLCCRFQNTKL